MSELLRIENLRVEYFHGSTAVEAVRQADLTIADGETLALVGESGCGKTTLALSIIGLLPKNQSRVKAAAMRFGGDDLLSLDEEGWRRLRGRRIAMIFQDPFAALNPVLTIGTQLMETLALDGRDSRENAAELLAKVQLDDAARLLDSYPHQMSGGQRQRALIAMALARRPALLIADEPTTALDVTIQDEIMKLLKKLQTELRMAMLFVTHNIGLVKQVAARTCVMYAGKVVEHGTTAAVLGNPQHPYTQGLLKSLPKLRPEGRLPMLEGQPPEPRDLPPGCSFHPRCPRRFEPCDNVDPVERPAEGTRVRCHLYPEH